jgi:hypothetical protein
MDRRHVAIWQRGHIATWLHDTWQCGMRARGSVTHGHVATCPHPTSSCGDVATLARGHVVRGPRP